MPIQSLLILPIPGILVSLHLPLLSWLPVSCWYPPLGQGGSAFAWLSAGVVITAPGWWWTACLGLEGVLMWIGFCAVPLAQLEYCCLSWMGFVLSIILPPLLFAAGGPSDSGPGGWSLVGLEADSLILLLCAGLWGS